MRVKCVKTVFKIVSSYCYIFYLRNIKNEGAKDLKTFFLHLSINQWAKLKVFELLASIIFKIPPTTKKNGKVTCHFFVSHILLSDDLKFSLYFIKYRVFRKKTVLTNNTGFCRTKRPGVLIYLKSLEMLASAAYN